MLAKRVFLRKTMKNRNPTFLLQKTKTDLEIYSIAVAFLYMI
jgi:hypothetical protein